MTGISYHRGRDSETSYQTTGDPNLTSSLDSMVYHRTVSPFFYFIYVYGLVLSKKNQSLYPKTWLAQNTLFFSIQNPFAIKLDTTYIIEQTYSPSR